jgi:Rap1a immunity proteins
MARRWTACCFAIIFSAAVPGSTFSQDPVDDAARTVTAGCPEALKRTGPVATFETGMCLGILKGLHYLSNDICIPPATSLSQMGDVVARYFDDHADKVRDDFQEMAIDAMRTAWPCGRKNNI